MRNHRQNSLPAPRCPPFERYLTVWVFLCIIAGVGAGPVRCRDRSRRIGRMEVARVNLPVGGLIWVMIIPMLLKVDFGALNRGEAATVKGIGVTLFVNWAGQAIFDGAAGLDLHPPGVRALAARRPGRQLHRRTHPAGRRALHGDGLRVEPADQRRPAVHAVAGGGERQHHGLRLRPHRRPAARHLRHHRALGHAGDFGGALHRDPAGTGATVAQGLAEKGPGTLRRP
jgi:hypothetical protein